MAIRIMIMAGGTGGHVFPALAVAQFLQDKGHAVSWLGTQNGIEARLVPEAGFTIDWLTVSGLRGKGIKPLLVAPFMLLKSCWQASKVIRLRQPNVVLGFGGFASGPGGLMAWVHGKPLLIHEQNRVPGTTNRLLKRLAVRVLEAFPNSFNSAVHAIYTGNPVRHDLLALEHVVREQGRHILVLGGSLGASVLNQVVPNALKALQNEMALTVIHQAGQSTLDAAKLAYQEAGVKAEISPFINDMKRVYEWADVVICRAGAMTISELSVMGLASILVPLPHAIDDHQTKNAEYLSESGAAVLVRQAAFTPEVLKSLLLELFSEPQRLRDMGAKARLMAKPDATELVANHCLQVAI